MNHRPRFVRDCRGAMAGADHSRLRRFRRRVSAAFPSGLTRGLSPCDHEAAHTYSHVADPWPDFPIAAGRADAAACRSARPCGWRNLRDRGASVVIAAVTPPLVERLSRKHRSPGDRCMSSRIRWTLTGFTAEITPEAARAQARAGIRSRRSSTAARSGLRAGFWERFSTPLVLVRDLQCANQDRRRRPRGSGPDSSRGGGAPRPGRVPARG